MYKKYTYQVKSGTEALIIALHELSAKKVIIPSYTCLDILNAVNEVGCEYHLSDCGLDLQIDVDDVFRVADDYDTIIIPHMFGIRADVKTIKEKTNLKIIEDLSQCHGLVGLGKYADIVISSTNKSKWLNFGRGGFVFSDKIIDLPLYNFDENPSIIWWASEEMFVKYVSPIDKRVHRYFPDFVVRLKKKDGKEATMMLEVKPEKQTKPPKQSRRTRKMLAEVATYAINQEKISWHCLQFKP